MCYYNGVKVTREAYLQLVTEDRLIEEYDQMMQSGFTYGSWPIITASKGQRIAQMAHWEFIPYWLRSWKEVEASRKKYTTLNAKGEGLLQSKIYREAALKRRCLVMSSGFYEWRHFEGRTYPYHISVEGRPLFFMAGVWQPWTDKETGEMIDSFAIVTTEANELMTQVHNTKKRMPTILSDDLAQEWLSEDLSEQRVQEIAVTHTRELLCAKTIVKNFREVINLEKSLKVIHSFRCKLCLVLKNLSDKLFQDETQFERFFHKRQFLIFQHTIKHREIVVRKVLHYCY